MFEEKIIPKEEDITKFRLLNEKDINEVLKIMEEIKPVIGGVRLKLLYRALCYESLIDKRVVFAIGENKGRIISFQIVVIDRNRWRFAFAKRHTFLLLITIFLRVIKRIPKIQKKLNNNNNDNLDPKIGKELSRLNLQNKTDRNWEDSNEKIAKSLYEAVIEEYRGKRIVGKMRDFVYDVLSNRGVKRIDAIILVNNRKAIRALVRDPRFVYKIGNSLFTSKDI